MGLIADKAGGLLERQLPGVLETAGRLSVDAIRQDISIPAPPSSRPGEPPHFRTGTLFSSVDFSVSQGDETVTIGVTRRGTPGVAAELERGSSRIRARPFMLPNMLKESNLLPALEKF